ncbi:RICIN domain-containing protein [Streptomyces sp. NPDC091259]|uniref:RICIN domain-containing protein n=1 Tax=Streptomyces sp. NPDC091259 TaxID=3365976 RepID=UPI00380847A2
MGVPRGVYRIRNVGGGLLLRVEGGNRVAVAPEAAEGPAASREWEISPVHSGGGVVYVVNVRAERRLDVANASTENGARVQVWKPNAFGAQEWIVEEHLDAPGVVSLIACVSGLSLEVDEQGRARQGEDADSPAQWWRLEPV